MRAIEDGAWSDAVRVRRSELEGRRARLHQDLAATEGLSMPEVHLRPGVIDRYGEQVARLEEVQLDEAMRGGAEEAFRALIDRVELTPDEAGPDGLAG